MEKLGLLMLSYGLVAGLMSMVYQNIVSSILATSSIVGGSVLLSKKKL